MTDTSTQGGQAPPATQQNQSNQQNGGQEGQAPPGGQQTGGDGQQDPWTDPAAARAEIERLRRESAGYRTEVRNLEPLAQAAREAEEANKTELERATGRATELETKVAETTLRADRLEVAMANGLTLDQAGRLRGTTKEEIEADVAQLRKDLGLEANEEQQGGQGGQQTGQRVPLGQPGAGAGEQLTDMNDWMRRPRSQ